MIQMLSWVANHAWLVATDAESLCQGATQTSCSTTKAGVQDGNGNVITDALTNHITAIITTLLTVAGAVAVVIIIIGGITYVTSAGDATRVKQAKDTILYAVIGLVVAILAYAIVKFTTNNVG